MLPLERRALLLLLLAPAIACGRRSVSSEGYRAELVRAVGDHAEIAGRGTKTRIARIAEGDFWITIRRPDLGKMWNYRLHGRHALKAIESRLRPGGYADFWEENPPRVGFDLEKYAEEFKGSARFRDHLFFDEHPCDVFEVTYFDGRVERIWLATDLSRLPIRIQRGRQLPSLTSGEPEFRAETDVQLLRIRPGAPEDLFELPSGATIIPGGEN
jgi:hypothetical protein